MTVALVATGGTIASTPTAGADAEPDLRGADLVEAVPELGELADLTVREFSAVPSPHFTVERMHDLAGVVDELDDDGRVTGVVVTQGTDVLEETAYFLDLCYDGDTPVAVTGAMRNPSLPGADGPANLLAAVRAVSSPEAADLGVLVAFNDRLHAAREATKVHTTNPDTFRTPEFGPLGAVDEDRVVWYRSPTRTDPTFEVDPDRLTADVHAVTATAEMPPEQVAVAAEGDGLCLAATGAGHVPPGVVPALEDLVAAGVPLVVTSRCPEGRLARNTYGFRGSEATLRELGARYSDVNLQKTRIRTIVALAAGRLEAAFERP